MTLSQEIGLSWSYYEPLAIPTARYLGELADEITAYSHTIDSFGGYGVGSISLVGNRSIAEQWFKYGLGRRIVTYNEAQNIIYEALVNQVVIKGGGISVSIGPLLEIVNRLRVVYTTVRYQTVPPIGGITKYTPETENAISVAKYGILYKCINGGTLHDVQAISLRNTHLYNNAQPKADESIEFPGGSTFAVDLSLSGYSAYMDCYTYQQLGAGTEALSDKIRSVIQYDPNDWLSDDFIGIGPNGLQVPSQDDDERTALTVVRDLVAHGDGNGNRMLFGVYEGRKAKYSAAPTTIKYTSSIEDPSQRIYDKDVEVMPWNLQPGHWIRITDLLVGEPVPIDPRKDMRNVFIESVSYSAPHSVSIAGSELDKLPQALAMLTSTALANS